jgi:Undecaprenyl-phosphate glucose phosphotransferase
MENASLIKERAVRAEPLHHGARVQYRPQTYRFSNETSPLHPRTIVAVIRYLDFGFIIGGGFWVFVLPLNATFATPETQPYFVTSIFAAIAFSAVLKQVHVYKLSNLIRPGWQSIRVTLIWTATGSVLLLTGVLDPSFEAFVNAWIPFCIVVLALLLAQRGFVWLVLNQWRRKGRLGRNIAIVGAGKETAKLISRILRSEMESIVCGIFDDRFPDGSRIPQQLCGHSVVGTTDALLELARQIRIDQIIITVPSRFKERRKALVDKVSALAVDVYVFGGPEVWDSSPGRLIYAENVPLLRVVDRPIKGWGAVAKWVEDKVLAFLLLLVFAPAMLIIAALIKIDSPGPVFFVQKRYGRNNSIIRVLKFRTMYVGCCDITGARRTVPADPRVTQVGRYLRLLSLDELPQLINVMKGDMSLVGPRPHALTMTAGTQLYHEALPQYFLRHRVKPGLTGWAQVHGHRGQIDTLERGRARLEYDLLYIEGWSLWLDLKILLTTPMLIIQCKNSY